jgi:type VI secretion system secreted protein VgrG
MAVEQDVQLLSDRVRALEARLRVLEDILGGSRIALEAGGNSIVIGAQGIEITTGTNLVINVGSNYKLDVGSNYTLEVGSNAVMTVGAGLAVTAGGAATTTVGGNMQTSVGGSTNTTAGRDVAVTAGTDIQLRSGRALRETVGQNLEMNVRKSATLISGGDLSMKTGDASIVAKKDGEVAIKGKDISIEASGKISCKAASDLILRGVRILEN